MSWIISKYLITAAVIVVISEVAKRSDKAGALISALPMVTILALIWIYIETGSSQKLANHAWYTFWYVIPTLPMFFVFPSILAKLGFWWTLAASAGLTMVCFWLFALAVKPLGIDLGL